MFETRADGLNSSHHFSPSRSGSSLFAGSTSKGDFQVLSDLVPASLPTWVTLYLLSQCRALVFSLLGQHSRVPGTWLYLFFSWDPFSPRLSQACALTSDGGLLRGHVLRGSTTTPSVVPLSHPQISFSFTLSLPDS